MYILCYDEQQKKYVVLLAAAAKKISSIQMLERYTTYRKAAIEAIKKNTKEEV